MLKSSATSSLKQESTIFSKFNIPDFNSQKTDQRNNISQFENYRKRKMPFDYLKNEFFIIKDFDTIKNFKKYYPLYNVLPVIRKINFINLSKKQKKTKLN